MPGHVEHDGELALTVVEEVIEGGGGMFGIGNGDGVGEGGIVESVGDGPGPDFGVGVEGVIDDELESFLFLHGVDVEAGMLGGEKSGEALAVCLLCHAL
jgi:hypothetical protein